MTLLTKQVGDLVALRDGTLVTLRPVGPDDGPVLADGLARLSPQSRYLRFHGAKDRLSASELAYLTHVDHRHHEAVLAFVDGELAGVGRAATGDDPQVADLALVVGEDFRRRGLARLLAERAISAVAAGGVRVVRADILATNRAARRLVEALGMHLVAECGPEVEYEVVL